MQPEVSGYEVRGSERFPNYVDRPSWAYCDERMDLSDGWSESVKRDEGAYVQGYFHVNSDGSYDLAGVSVENGGLRFVTRADMNVDFDLMDRVAVWEETLEESLNDG